MRKLALLTIIIFAAVLSAYAAGRRVEDSVVEVPFFFEKGYVIVQAKIKDDVPVDMLLATGAEYSSVDPQFLEKYKLQSYYTGVGKITGHNDRIMFYSTVPVSVGEIKKSYLNMRLNSLANPTKSLGREIFGILGGDFFKGRVVQFDFSRKVVRFLPRSENNPSRGFMLKMMLSLSDTLTLPIVEGVTFNGKKIKTLVDTGVVTVASLSAATAKQVGLAAPPEKSMPLRDKITSLHLGEEELANVPVFVYPKGSDFDRDEYDFGAIVGTILLQNFVVTFDFRNKVIFFARN